MGVLTMLRRKLVRGFTIVELVAVLVGAVLIGVVVLVVVSRSSRAVFRDPQLTDPSQIRGIMQAMAIWAESNKGRYPLPSDIDPENSTVADIGPSKDTTANILSILVFNGLVATDMLVSPAEFNGNIRQYSSYEFKAPKTAVAPDRALWDPALSVDFSGTNLGATSYAHLLPSGPRLDKWKSDLNAVSPILGNRGPQITSVTKNPNHTVTATVANAKSNTFQIHGDRKAWKGNIGFNDTHVDFKTHLVPEQDSGLVYCDASGMRWPDLYHYDEPDDPTGTNAFLGIFTKAGPRPADFTAIWD